MLIKHGCAYQNTNGQITATKQNKSLIQVNGTSVTTTYTEQQFGNAEGPSIKQFSGFGLSLFAARSASFKVHSG